MKNTIFIPFQLGLMAGGIAGAPLALAQEGVSLEPHQEVISRQVIEKDDGGTVTYNRVTPANIAPARPVQQQDTQTFSDEDSETIRETAVMESLTLMLHGTTYIGGMTLLEWREEGVAHRAVSNLDFSILPDMGQFETEDHRYIFMLLIQRTNDPAPDWMKSFGFRAGRGSAYAVIDDQKQRAALPSHLQGLDALHSYFDAHKTEIIDAHLMREAENRRREAELKANPPQPESPTINYWIRSETATPREPETPDAEAQ